MSKKITIETIKAKDLGIDDRVQRHAEDTQMKYLHREWREDSVGIAIVWVREDGKKVLLDGQQRWRTQMELFENPDYAFTCQVYYGLDEAEAAQVFLDANNSKNVGLFPKWRIAERRGEDWAVLLKKALEDVGVEPSPRNAWGVPPKTCNFSVMKRIIQEKNGKTMAENATAISWAYRVYLSVWTGPPLHLAKQKPFRSEIIEGLAMFYQQYSDDGVTDKRMIKQLQVTKAKGTGEIEDLLKFAKAKKGGVGSNRVSPQVAEVLLDLYNKGLSTKRVGV